MPRFRLAALLVATGLAVAACAGDSPATSTAPGVDDLPDPPRITGYRYVSELAATIDSAAGPTTFLGVKEGVFVAPDSHLVVSDLEFADAVQPRESVTVVGDAAWYDDGSGWQAVTAGDARVRRVVADFTSVGNRLLPGGDVRAAVAGLAGTPEVVGEYETLRFDVPGDDVRRLDLLTQGAFFEGAEAAGRVGVSVWIDTAGGALIRSVLSVSGPASLLGDVGSDLGPGSTVDINLTVELSAVNDPELRVEPPQDAAPPAADTGERLESAAGGFTLDYPESWSLGPAQDDGTGVLVTLLPPGSGTARLAVTSTVTANTTLDEWAAAGLEAALTGPGLDVVASDRFDLPAGPAALIDHEGEGPTGPVKVLQPFLVLGDRGYLLEWRGPAAEFDDFLPEAAAIIAGFVVFDG